MKGEMYMKLTWNFTGGEYQLLDLEANRVIAAIKYNGKNDLYSCNINGVKQQLKADDITEAKRDVARLLLEGIL